MQEPRSFHTAVFAPTRYKQLSELDKFFIFYDSLCQVNDGDPIRIQESDPLNSGQNDAFFVRVITKATRWVAEKPRHPNVIPYILVIETLR